MYIEMFPWERPLVFDKVTLDFKPPSDDVNASPIVHNAGLYNGFLMAALIWGIFSARNGFAIQVFCLTCAIIAGVFGAWTLKTANTLLLQTLPGALALAAVMWERHAAGANR